MNQSVTRLTLDVSVQEKQASISIRQYDTMRRLVFSLVDRGLPYILESGVHAYISAKTAATTYVLGGCVIQDNAVHFDVPSSMTLEPGENECELILSASDNRILCACGFDILVFSSNASDYADDIVASDDFSALLDAIAEAKELIEKLKEAFEKGKLGQGTFYTVRVPAAGAAELYGWTAAQSGYELNIPNVEWMTENLVVELKSENAALFTEHNIVLYQDNGFLEFSIDSLPERESVLYIYVPTVVNGGLLNGGEA